MKTTRTKPTYHEISQKTGISPATISRVLNNTANVSSPTREKVFEAIASMGFDITRLAKRREKSDLLLLNIPSFGNPFYARIIDGARDSALRNGYSLLVSENELDDKNDVDNFLSLVGKTKSAGVIITNSLSLETLLRIDHAVPVVQCCECRDDSNVPFVTIDDLTAARSAVEHLISLGKRKIAFINGPLAYKYARDRLNGYRSALLAASLPVDVEWIIQLGEINYDMALSAAYQMLNSEDRPDGFFTSSDVYAAAVVKAAKRAGLRVPEDVAVVGFDNIEISSMCTPSITTVSQPRYQMGLLSCDLLCERISSTSLPLKNMYLETELIVRESTTRAMRTPVRH
ncbi:MAG: LacI family DNA-binding transcriptional regulator [Sphaerochaetaceae bacterium]|jgi:LacI family repressor for deo operon, udp, cdd, tsx, nupC, and nupG